MIFRANTSAKLRGKLKPNDAVKTILGFLDYGKFDWESGFEALAMMQNGSCITMVLG
jgi:hypothetical protein